MAPKSTKGRKVLTNRSAEPPELCKHLCLLGTLKRAENIRLIKKTHSSFNAYSQEMAATNKLIITKLTTLKPTCNGPAHPAFNESSKWQRAVDFDEEYSESKAELQIEGVETEIWPNTSSTNIAINNSTNSNKKYYNKLTNINDHEPCVIVTPLDRQQQPHQQQQQQPQTELRQHFSFIIRKIIMEVVLMLSVLLSRQHPSHQHHRKHQRKRYNQRQSPPYGFVKLCHRCRPAFRVVILIYVAVTIVDLADCNGAAGGSSPRDSIANVSGELLDQMQYGSSSVIEGLSNALGVEIKDTQTTQDVDGSTLATPMKTMVDAGFHIHSPHSQNASKRVVHQSSVISFINRDNVLQQYNNNKLEAVDSDKTTVRDTMPLPDVTDSTETDLTVETTTSIPAAYTTNRYSTCPSCHMREKAKHDNLESIKTNILMRLQLKKLPNVTVPRVVPHNIIENFYKSFNGSHHRQNIGTKSENNGGIIILGEENVNIDKEMQNDDPFAYTSPKRDNNSSDDYYFTDQQFDYDDEQEDYDMHNEDEFFSRVNSVYVFPTTPRIRHNRRPEILNFRFDNMQATISRAIMHIFIRGIDWIRENEPGLLEQRAANGCMEERTEIVIAVHRAVRRPNAVNYTHTVRLTESKHGIPTGMGQWVKIELKELADHWRDNLEATQGLVIKGQETWMRPLIVTGDNALNKPLSVHIEVLTKEKRRHKRSTSLDCQESDHEVRCCRYPLKVNFTSFGWTFVVAPTSFDAYFCNGECRLGYLEQYTHTHITSLTPSATPCCTPTKLSSLSLLYFDGEQNLVFSTIPNMSVEKCSCS